MVIPERIRRELVEHARTEEPNEACGLIAFRDGVAERYVPGVNEEPSPYYFRLGMIDPDIWFLAAITLVMILGFWLVTPSWLNPRTIPAIC